MTELNPQDIQLIERHFNGQLDAHDNAVFIERQATDRHFKAAVESYEDAVLAVKLAGEDDIRAILKEEQAKLDKIKIVSFSEKQLKKHFLLRGPLLAAASLAFLLIAGYWFFNQKKELDIETLMADKTLFSYRTNTWLIVNRGEEQVSFEQRKKDLTAIYGEQKTSDIIEAMSGYACIENLKCPQKQAEKAVQTLLALDIPDETFQLYRINAALYGREPVKALEMLKGIKTPSLKSAIDWYSAIAYLQMQKKAEAMLLLKEISQEANSPFALQAQKLLAVL